MKIPWKRTNFRGREVTLLGGALLAGQLVTGHTINALRGDSASWRIAAASLGAGLVGGYDDMTDKETRNKTTKGLHGHLGALAQGRLSPGAVKMLGLVATGMLAAKPRREVLEWLVEAGIIAGGANLVNLFDLRPGRALKVASLAGLTGMLPRCACGGSGQSPKVGRQDRALVNLFAIGAAFPMDVREYTMLGDMGANSLGAALAATWIPGRSRGAKLAVLAVITALTLASEKISFSAVIENNPLMKTLDELGRRRDNQADETHNPAPAVTDETVPSAPLQTNDAVTVKETPA